MKNKFKFCVRIALAAFLCLGVFRPGEAMEDKIIAIVNDDVITLRDLRDYLNSAYMQLSLEQYPREEIQAIMSELEVNGLTKLIEDQLILSEAKRIGLEVRDQMVDERVATIKNRYGTEENFLKALLSGGATVTDLRNKISEQLKMKFIVEAEVRKKIYVNPQEVTEYYKVHFENFQKPERLHLDSIFVAKSGDDDTARQKVKAALTKIRKGEDFLAVAEEFSEGPSIGVIEKGKMLPAIEKAVFPLKENDISPIIEVDQGFYLFHVNQKMGREVSPLEDVKDQIHNILFQDKFRVRYRSWIDKLKKEAFIEIKE